MALQEEDREMAAGPSKSARMTVERSARPTTTSQMTHCLRMMSSEIDMTILRGVSSHTVLRRCGSAFREHEFEPENYNKSFTVSSLDDFVSHDWGSPATGKVLALCLIYNGLPAAAVSLAVGALLAIGESRRAGFLPIAEQDSAVTAGTTARLYGYWCQALCPVVYVVTFFFWQDLRAALSLRTRSVFLDKYCIDQTDGEKKAQGILGLAGFLRYTERLIICWTPRYFTRLWCTYEVASWLSLDKPLSSVLFMPVSHAQHIAVGFLAVAGACALFACSSVFFPSRYLLVMGGASAAVIPGACHVVRRHMRDIRRLPQQLDDFSITNAACFCCANSHRMPRHPERKLPCDRHLVHRTVAHWFPTGDDDEAGGLARTRQISEEKLRAFDCAVRELFGPWVLKSAGPTRLQYKYIVLAGLPFAFRMLDWASTIGRNPDGYLIKMLIGVYPAQFLAVLPMIGKLTLHLLCSADSWVGAPTDRRTDFLLTLGLSVLLWLLLVILWVPINVAADSFQGPLPTFAFAGLLHVLVALVFADEWADLLPSWLRRSPWGHPSWAGTCRWATRRLQSGAGTHSPEGLGGAAEDADAQVRRAAGAVKWDICDSAVAEEGMHNL